MSYHRVHDVFPIVFIVFVFYFDSLELGGQEFDCTQHAVSCD